MQEVHVAAQVRIHHLLFDVLSHYLLKTSWDCSCIFTRPRQPRLHLLHPSFASLGPSKNDSSWRGKTFEIDIWTSGERMRPLLRVDVI